MPPQRSALILARLSILVEMDINRHQAATVGRLLLLPHFHGLILQLEVIVNKTSISQRGYMIAKSGIAATFSGRMPAQANGCFSLRPTVGALPTEGMWSGVP